MSAQNKPTSGLRSSLLDLDDADFDILPSETCDRNDLQPIKNPKTQPHKVSIADGQAVAMNPLVLSEDTDVSLHCPTLPNCKVVMDVLLSLRTAMEGTVPARNIDKEKRCFCLLHMMQHLIICYANSACRFPLI